MCKGDGIDRVPHESYCKDGELSEKARNFPVNARESTL